jgi:hypothetical protein
MGTLHCATAHVPMSMCSPSLMSPIERATIDPIYTVQGVMRVEAADAVCVLVRNTHTNDAYDTGGAIHGETLIHNRNKWKLTKTYKKQLKAIAKRYQSCLDDIISVDQSFRLKRGRGNVKHTGSDGVVRDLVFFERCLGPIEKPEAAYGQMCASWFDVSFRTSVPTQHVFEGPSEQKSRQQQHDHVLNQLQQSRPRFPRVCTFCNQPDASSAKLMPCSVCKGVMYCSVNCQKRHWAVHKKKCSSREA